MLITALSFVVMKWYAVSVGRLGDPSISDKHLQQSSFKIWAGPMLCTLAISLAFLETYWAIVIYVIIPIIYFLPDQFERKIN